MYEIIDRVRAYPNRSRNDFTEIETSSGSSISIKLPELLIDDVLASLLNALLSFLN